MANNSFTYFGFIPSGDCYRIGQYTAGGTVYPGDCVKLNSTSQVVQAGATDALCGVALGYATSGNTLMVADHPSQTFESWFANSTTAPQSADIGSQCSLFVGSPNTTYKTSGMAVDYNTDATSVSTLTFGIVRYGTALGNDATLANTKVVVRINKHQLAQGAGIVAI
jgi:hypothetical protein